MPRRLNSLISGSLLILVMLIPSPDAEAKLLKGVLAGWNYSDWDHQVDSAPYHWFEPKNGFCVGLFAGDTLSGAFGWRAEILYTRKGATSVETATDEQGQSLGEVNYFYNVDYMEIPLLASFTISSRGKVHPVVFLGPAFGLELSSGVKAEYPSGVANDYQSEWGLEDTSSTDFSLIFGAGVEMTSGPHLIMLQVRFVMGLKEVYREAKNKTLTVMAGFGL